jgi:muramoyltetrapeptide carboxypeptidase
MPLDKSRKCIDILEGWGFKVNVGRTVGGQHNYFSGTDEERLQELQQMLDNETVKAIFCARGGYGLSRIIDKLNFDRFVDAPKWVVGYSDITLLHAHIYSNFRIASLHAPMAAAFNEIEDNRKYIDSILTSLTGRPSIYETNVYPLNKPGNSAGGLIGGNLAILVHLIGTDSDLDTSHKILFIEDIGEYKYNIDRMLMQLKRAGKLESLSGLIIGSFADMKDTTIPFGQEIHDLIFDKISEYDYPVCFDFPVGHTGENYALKIGVKYRLTVSAEQVILAEMI